MDVLTAKVLPEPRKVCVNATILVDSTGLWGDHDIHDFTLPAIQIQIVLILGCQHALHFLLRLLRIPSGVSQIVVGLAFSALFKWVDRNHVSTGYFTVPSQEILSTITLFGFVLYLFLTGVKMDAKTVLKRAGPKAIVIGLITVVVPMLTSMMTTAFLTSKWLPPTTDSFIQMSVSRLSMINVATTFPVILALLYEMEILTSELGRLAVSSAIVGDATHFVLLLALLIKTHSETKTLIAFITAVCSALAIVYLVRPVLFWIIKQTPEGRQVKNVYVVSITIGLLLVTASMKAFHVLTLVTPFIIGLMIPEGPPLGSALVQKLDPLVSGLLMPVYVTTCAMRVNLHEGMLRSRIILINLMVAAVVQPVKLIACTMTASLFKIPLRDCFSLALIMCSKGALDVVSLALLKDRNAVTEDGFTTNVLLTLAMGFVIPLLVRFLFDQSRHFTAYVRRNVEMLSHEDELRTLVCINRNESIPMFLNFLNAGPPTPDSPMDLTVIHLVELLGRSSPVLISHFHTVQRRETETDATGQSTQFVIDAFRNYKKKYEEEAMKLDVYTSITTVKLMPTDICTLALDKVASLIILAFHVEWAEDGTLEYEDFKLKNLNMAVMERAPCSVGILINRGNLTSAATISLTNTFTASYFNIALLYFGGGDDREAASVALRMMANSGNTTLTVIHFKTAGAAGEAEEGFQDCDAADKEVLERMQALEAENRRMKCMEEVVKDGPETALILRSIVNDYDLMVVGRREGVKSSLTSGLGEWSEYPELGVVGDLLAVADLETRTSVLVLQQQKLAKTVLR
uniref:Cation/H+ exchanger domain-containing protein n=1 Tax=Kalanchoe fedtschenkoi TaxID=63787 RepID=A0A7N0TGH8_KALFE